MYTKFILHFNQSRLEVYTHHKIHDSYTIKVSINIKENNLPSTPIVLAFYLHLMIVWCMGRSDTRIDDSLQYCQ